MDAGKLLGIGLLPEDLPSAFSTESLWSNYADLRSINVLEKESAATNYNAPKRSNFRRLFEIPNPLHQIKLAKGIADNWDELQEYFLQSRFSTSRPVEDVNAKRAIKRDKAFPEFKDMCEMQAYQFKYKLKLDISSFFPTIYTHTFGWALHGRSNGRVHGLLGNQLDVLVRNTNKKQSVGIPVGPDTSIVLSEIIGTSLDLFIQEKWPQVAGFRYVDDMNLYFDTRSEAEKSLEVIQAFLSEYHLSLNDSKTYISETIDPTDDPWVIALSSFEISQNEDHQRESIKRFFSLIFDFSNSRHSASAAKFGVIKILRTLEKNEIKEPNYNIVNSLLFRVCMHHPECLGIVFKFIDENREYFDLEMIKNLSLKILKDCASSNRNYEIIWSLWLMSRLEIVIEDSQLIDILSNRLGLETIQLFDMMERGLAERRQQIDISRIGEINDENWMLIYTLQSRGWTNNDYISSNAFFSKLNELQVQFYCLENASTSDLSRGDY